MAEPNKYLIRGNDLLIRQTLMQMKTEELQLDRILEELQNLTAGSSSRPLPSDVKGKILVKLHFKGVTADTAKPHRVESSFRLMTDDPRTISQERLMFLGNRIKSKFNTFSFTTGKTTYTYNSPEQGFNRTWGYFATQSDATRLFEQLLDIPSLSPDWRRLTQSNLPMPGNRFQVPADKVLQANVSIRTDQERPTALVKFNKAGIKFPHIRQELEWVDKYLYVHDVHAAIQALAKKD